MKLGLNDVDQGFMGTTRSEDVNGFREFELFSPTKTVYSLDGRDQSLIETRPPKNVSNAET